MRTLDDINNEDLQLIIDCFNFSINMGLEIFDDKTKDLLDRFEREMKCRKEKEMNY